MDVEVVFAGETITFLDDRYSYNETRFLAFGLLWGSVVAISHTETNEVMRIISVRKATKNEEIVYHKEIKN